MAFDTKDLLKDIVFKEKIHSNILTFHTTWGLFSPKEVDAGTKLLLANLAVNPKDQILDLGCGYGSIGLSLAKLAYEGTTHLIDKDFVAIEFARKNAQINGIENVKIYLSNAFSSVTPNVKFDVIVSNLPAKVGKEMLWIMLDGAKEHLKPGGALYVVTIAGLKDFIKRNFQETFGNYEKIAQAKGYMVAKGVRE